MTDPRTEARPHYWQRHTDGSGAWTQRGPAPGADLAALRRGIGREPGTVPEMWPYYTALSADGRLSARLRAEHLALTLFAVHQQSQRQPVHRGGVGLGTALLKLRERDKSSAAAVDRRFGAAATATTLSEVGHHLRGLITQLRGVTSQPGLDYTQLVDDLYRWQFPDGQARVRRRWGSQYFAWSPKADAPAGTPA
jgi:CRISPR system Cascade subunit CasB